MGGTAPEDTPHLRFALNPALGLLESPWPVDRIWRANRAESRESAPTSEAPIDLAEGGVRLEIDRQGEAVVMRTLAAADLAFRRALGAAEPLEQAAEPAFEIDEGFDLAAALAGLFRENLVVAVTLAGA